MVRTWSWNGPWNYFFLNLHKCAQGCFMPNFTWLGISSNPLSLKWPKYCPLWPKQGPHIVLKIGSIWFLIAMSRVVPCQISHCWVYPVASFLRNGQNMALLWPKHGSHMVLQFGYSCILIYVPRDVSCQISHCWVYPVVPFPRNGQNKALHGWNMVLTWSMRLVRPES